ncbi:hypothetical protein MTO96_023487 [Rhipicephalus appendiculatus]
MLVFTFIVILSSLLFWWLRKTFTFWNNKDIAHLTFWQHLRYCIDLYTKPLKEVIIRNYNRHGRLYGSYQGVVPTLVVGDPDILREILVTKFKNFSDRTIAIKVRTVAEKMVSRIEAVAAENKSVNISEYTRLCTEETTVAGIRFQPGMCVDIPLAGIHHDAEYFPEPDKFNAERTSRISPFWQHLRYCIDLYTKPLKEVIIRNYNRHGRLYGSYQGVVPTLVVGDPDILREILVTKFKNFSDRTIAIKVRTVAEKMVSRIEAVAAENKSVNMSEYALFLRYYM